MIRQSLADGQIWTSEPLEASDRRGVIQQILGAYAADFRARRAETLDGDLIFGVDAKGREVTK